MRRLDARSSRTSSCSQQRSVHLAKASKLGTHVTRELIASDDSPVGLVVPEIGRENSHVRREVLPFQCQPPSACL